jgi:hypothetical protein
MSMNQKEYTGFIFSASKHRNLTVPFVAIQQDYFLLYRIIWKQSCEVNYQTMITKETPEWKDIYNSWQIVCERVFEPILTDAGFTEIELQHSPVEDIIDWLPNKVLLDIETNGYHSYSLQRGTIITAENLWNSRDNLEGMALAWIEAFLWNKRKSLRELWHGETIELVHELYEIVWKKTQEFKLFNDRHWKSTESFPVSLEYIGSFYQMCKPTTYDEIIDLIALENILVRTTWSLVHVTKSQ